MKTQPKAKQKGLGSLGEALADMCKTRSALAVVADKEASQLAGKQQAKQVESIDKDKTETSLPAVSDSFNHALPATFEPVSGDNGPEKAVLSDSKEGGGGKPKPKAETI